MSRAACAVLVAAPLVLATGAALPAAATGPAACDGVLVVVDFADGRVETGCAEGDPTTGEEALREAGFEVAVNGAGVVCRLDGFPRDCPASPPFDAYWGYWHADGQDPQQLRWTYSQAGPAFRDPAPGTAEGWRFGGNGQVAPGYGTDVTPGRDTAGSTAGTADSTARPDAEPGGSAAPTLLTLGGVAAAAAALGAWQWSRRRRG